MSGPWDLPNPAQALNDLAKLFKGCPAQDAPAAPERKKKPMQPQKPTPPPAPSEVVLAFGRSIAKRMAALDLSEEDVATILAIDLAALRNIFDGTNRILSLEKAAYISSALGIELSLVSDQSNAKEAKVRLSTMLQERQEQLDAEIKAAEERIASLRQKKAFSTRMIAKGRETNL